jgi:hypothetical protein
MEHGVHAADSTTFNRGFCGVLRSRITGLARHFPADHLRARPSVSMILHRKKLKISEDRDPEARQDRDYLTRSRLLRLW